MSELHYISAGEALARFRSRELSPVDLMEAVIARAEEVEPTVGAFAQTHFETALAAAREAEARYAGRGEEPRALEGLPVAIKEEEAIEGQPWTLGSLIYKDQVADHTSAFVRRQLDAGAIVHARTTTPEFSCAGFTHSRLWGVTRNPHNPELAVGGSSGGSGASLAAGTATLASGSDIGGSIRMPACANGVVGFKPPYGRVPVDPPFNLDTYCHCGPLARTVADCALYENVLAGPEPTDIHTLRERVVLPDRFEGASGLRVAFSLDLGGWSVDPDVAENTLAVADALREAGALVEEVDLEVPREKVSRAMSIHFATGFGAWLAGLVEAHPDLVSPYVPAVVRSIKEEAGDASALDGWELECELYAPVGSLLERYDALVIPTCRVEGLDAGEDYVERPLVMADGTELHADLEAFTTPVFNVMSRCPVLAVPSGRGARGGPTGVQIAGRTYDDLTVFRLGAALEAVRPWDQWPSTVAHPAGSVDR
ncbi:MAG TPA: amidase [Solirubrobacteraceae bacterium]|nr:amidase [Solirubrobacteraceae bacterium]